MFREPGDHLRTHRAPAGLVGRALAQRPPHRPDRTVWALAAAFLLGLGAGALLRDRIPDPAPAEVAAVSGAVDSPDIVTRVPHHLEFRAPGASAVAVAGTWNGWRAEPLSAANEGTFHVLLSLPQGRYEYMFVVDGREWKPDPRAPITRDDGFGRRNSVLEI